MRKDPTEFRERFQRWKKGEQVYKDGLPHYEDGKDASKLEYHPKEDYYYGGKLFGNKDLVVTGQNKKQKPYFVSSNSGQATFSDLNRMYNVATVGLLPNPFQAAINLSKGNIKQGLADMWLYNNESSGDPNKNYGVVGMPVPDGSVLKPLQYQIERLPGYMLKSLMEGNALEKQLSKAGTISTNSITAHAAKASEVEKSVIGKVLQSEQFAGKKSIDYNQFRRAIQDELITYDRVPSIKYEDYGVDRLGYEIYPKYQEDNAVQQYNDIITRIHDFELLNGTRSILTRRTRNDPAARQRLEQWNRSEIGQQYHQLMNEFDEFFRTHPGFQTEFLEANVNRKMVGHAGDIDLNTYTFESPRIPVGNGKHYNDNTLGHSRTYTTKDEPQILHVMESQSDWAQDGRHILNKANPTPVQEQHLIKNYQQRQIQENLKYAAQHGQTKMRYPTSETAAKIEGYSKQSPNHVDENIIEQFWNDNKELQEINWRDYYNGNINSLSDYIIKTVGQDKYNKFLDKIGNSTYSPQHQTILKKYADFPKQFKKLWKDQEVRTVSDKKGNTWYEVDVPKNFLNREWIYSTAPWLIGGTIYGTKQLNQPSINGQNKK